MIRVYLVYRSLKPLLKRAGLKEIRFHDLRHTFATLMLEQGENEIVLEAAASQAEEVLAWLRAHMRECCRQLLGEDLATEDCVEGKVEESWTS